MRVLAGLLTCLPLIADEAAVRAALSRPGRTVLPAGVHQIHREIELTRLNATGSASGTTLRAAADFVGRALIVVRDARKVRLERIAFDGNRAALEQRVGFPPSNITFAEYYRASAVLIEASEDVLIERARFRDIASFAVLIRKCRNVRIRGIDVRSSGSRLQNGRNNGTGGVLLEDGTADFSVTGSRFSGIRGNAVWTHSRLDAVRNSDGVIRDNTFDTIGRDAVQVGHAERVRVEGNTLVRIGFPLYTVDQEGGGIPVGIDTAGNVSESLYTRNVMTEVNGKCIDLDGFHHGEVSFNRCRNHGGAEDYPNGHYAVVFNNNNPQMQSEQVYVHNNRIDGMKFGGVFVLGRDHRIENNTMTRLNLAGCPESHARYHCLYFAGQPDLLSSGIYLGVSAAEWSRQEPATGNTISGNTITGHGMSRRCVMRAPAVSADANTVSNNVCREAQ